MKVAVPALRDVDAVDRSRYFQALRADVLLGRIISEGCASLSASRAIRYWRRFVCRAERRQREEVKIGHRDAPERN